MKIVLKLLPLLVLLISLKSNAQNEKAIYYYGTFQKGANVRLFGDKVNIRAGPSVKDNIITNLSAGTPLTIVKKMDNTYKVNGFTSDWYEVSFISGTEEKKGYVWGGMFSLISFEMHGISGGKNALLLYGITVYDSAKYQFSSQLRLIRNDSMISALTFEPIWTPFGKDGVYNYCIEGEILGNSGFTGVENIIKLEYIYGACSYNNGNILVFWNGKKLIYGLEVIRVGEAGLFSFTYELVYPDQKEGKADKLLVKYNDKEFNENMAVTRDTSYFEEYRWNGCKMITPE